MEYDHREFKDQDVDLDNNEFTFCRFDNCDLHYRGTSPVRMANCTLGAFTITLDDAAGQTILFLNLLYHANPEFRKIVEGTFDRIRKEGPPAIDGWSFQ